MRPSSSSDPNAPYRAAIASLVDSNLLADEPGEQANTANPAYPSSPFAGLSLIRASSSNPSNAVADAGPSSRSNVHINLVLEYLHEKGFIYDNLKFTTILMRLNSANLSAETLLTR